MKQHQGKNAGAPGNFTERQKIQLGDPNDGSLAVSFSESDLEVHADFFPPVRGGRSLSANTVGAILRRINVVYGIRWNDIQEALYNCDMGRRQIKNVVIARGDPPVNEIPAYFEVNPLLGQNPPPEKRTGRIDYRARSPFIIVKKGQTLAKLRPRRPGKEGKNVHGAAVPFSVVRPGGVAGGNNTRTEGNLIVSEINGQLVERQNTLHVQETLVINGPVGYATGNIVFPGDVMIEGPVSDGFKICSGGSVTIKQTFDATEAITKGDLVVMGGIIGRGPALLKSGGGIRTRFIENCRAAARKSIVVDSEINNSSVFTLERIEMGDKGLILGSDVYAVHGIKTGGIGKKTGKATRVHCGVDFTVQQEKEKTNNRMRILAAKLAKLRELIALEDTAGEKRAKMEELLRRLEEEQRIASARLGGLLDRINTDEKAAVEVSGEICPGTLIEICQIALFVADPLRKVRIRLDAAGGKLVTESL